MANTKNIDTHSSGSFTFKYGKTDTSCPGNIHFESSDTSWLTVTTSNNPASPVTVNYTENDGGERSAKIKVYYNTTECTAQTISVTQVAKPADLCGGLTVNKGTTALTSDATAYTITFAASTGDIASISVSKTSGSITPNTSSGSGSTGANSSYTFEFDANESISDEKTYNGTYAVTITSSTTSSTCTGTVEFKQAKAAVTCGCDNFTLGSDPTEWAYNNTDSKDVSVTSGSCISGITISNPSHFTATLGSDKIIISPNGENTTTSPYEETITIDYKANGSSCPISKTISVKQNAHTCPTAECTCYIVGTATTETIASSTTAVTVTFPYTAITVTTAATCTVSSSETTSTSTYEVTGIPINETCGDIMRTGSFTWTDHKACGTNSCSSDDVTVNWEVNQSRGKEATDPECTGCYCSGFTLGTSPSDWGCDEIDERSISYSADTCLTNITATTSDSHFTVSADATNKKIKVKPTGKNTTNSNITATVTVNYKANGSDCESKTFTVKHNSGSTCYCPDDCDSITAFSITKTSLEASGETSWTAIGSYGINQACDDSKFGVDSNSTSWLTLSAHSGTIYAKWSAATSYTATRSATITAQWDTTDCGSKTATVTQDSLTCTCDNVTANTVTTSFPQTGGTITVWKVLYDCGSVEPMSASCDSKITSVFTANTEGGVEIKATADANSTIGDVTCEIGYIFKPNASSSCTSNSTVVTLPSIGCGCDNLSIDKSSVTITAGTSDTVTITPSCTSLGTVSVADSTIAEATRSDNTITITGKKQGSTTVTLNYTAGSNTCTKTINVTVNCPTYTINPSGGSGSGGTVTFSVS